MARKQESIFNQAAAAIENGTSADCTALILELEQLQAREQAEAADVRPPGQRVTGGDGRVYGVLPTGPRFQRAAESDDGAAAAADCALEFDRLTARLEKVARLLPALRKRHAAAIAEERLAAAPGDAKKAIAALDQLIDRQEAARQEFERTQVEVRTTFNALLEARKLDPSAPGPSMELFYRAGVALAYDPPKRKEAIEGGFSEPQRVTTPLFGHAPAAVTNAKILLDVPKSVWQRTRELLGTRDLGGRGLDAHHTPDSSDRAVRERLADWYIELIRLLGAGRFDEATKLDPPTYKRGRPRFGQDAA